MDTHDLTQSTLVEENCTPEKSASTSDEPSFFGGNLNDPPRSNVFSEEPAHLNLYQINRRKASLYEIHRRLRPFKDCNIFFYDALQLPEVLNRFLKSAHELDELQLQLNPSPAAAPYASLSECFNVPASKFRSGHIKDCITMRIGDYKSTLALIRVKPVLEAVVKGVAVRIKHEAQLKFLVNLLSEYHRLTKCKFYLPNDAQANSCFTFEYQVRDTERNGMVEHTWDPKSFDKHMESELFADTEVELNAARADVEAKKAKEVNGVKEKIGTP